ncbi:MAG: DUF2029 domain-containing protein, partial [Anaerolineae bacterium]|nr:DUF2029 domain-containing protein [Anaerolineae bacterium]
MSGRRATTLFLLLVLAVLALNVLGTYQALTRPFPGHNDFMSRWEGVRSFVHDGLNPYGPEASLNIQRQIFGRAALPEEDPGYFAYPFYTVLLLWPLVLVDYALASALWMVLLEACLVGALLLLVQVFRWRPAPLLTAGLLVWTLIAYYPARGLLLGQPGLLVYALEVLALWALLRRRDGLAGAALALSTLKPQMGYLIVPFLLLWALREQRYRFAGSFALSFGGLLALSFLLLPSWFSDWLAQLALYPSYTAFGSPVWILSHWLTPGIDPATGALMGDARAGQALDLVLTGLLYALLLW